MDITPSPQIPSPKYTDRVLIGSRILEDLTADDPTRAAHLSMEDDGVIVISGDYGRVSVMEVVDMRVRLKQTTSEIAEDLRTTPDAVRAAYLASIHVSRRLRDAVIAPVVCAGGGVATQAFDVNQVVADDTWAASDFRCAHCKSVGEFTFREAAIFDTALATVQEFADGILGLGDGAGPGDVTGFVSDDDWQSCYVCHVCGEERIRLNDLVEYVGVKV